MKSTSMTAWRVRHPGRMATHPLERVTVPVPSPAPGELLVAVRACGVCRTDLHVAEGDLPVHRPGVIPGHEVVAEVVALGEDVGDGFGIGYRALRRAETPAGGRLGIYGFGGSAHITAQVALAEGVEVHVMTRGAAA